MCLSETILALEEGLITENEAFEQAGVSNLSELYECYACRRIEMATHAVDSLARSLH